MDFLDPRKKRANLIKLYIGYGLMAIVIGFGTVVLLYSSFGYGVDRRTGKVIQNGLVFVSSKPSGATIKLVPKDGKKQPDTQTDTRLTIPANQYDITLSKEGYRDWQRKFELDGGSVERLVYPLLFPNNLVTTDVQLYAAQPKLITESPDKRWILVQRPGSETDFEVFDANKPDPTAVISAIPASLLTAGPNQSLKVVEWSSNNKHVLLKHTFGDSYEFVLFNHENAGESININKQFNITPSEVVMFDKQPEQIYVYMTNGGVLQKGHIKDKKITPLLTNVVKFKPHGTDMIEYISTDTVAKDGKVAVKLRTNGTDYLLRELPTNTSYLLDIAKFDNRWYMVAGAQSENRVYIYEDPLDALRSRSTDPDRIIPVRTTRVDNPQKVSFSANARFIAVQGVNQQFTVYDADMDRQYRYQIDKPLDASAPATWMDGHRLVSVSEGKIVVFDFDGSNVQVLNSALTGTTPQFDREYSALFSLSASEQVKGRFALSRTSLLTIQ